MELVRELIVTGVVAVLLSFLIAKLVSLATSSGDSSHDSQIKNVNREVITAAEITGEEEGKVITEGLRFGERLEVEELKSETKTEFVEQVTEKVDEFVTESFAFGNVKESATRVEILLETEARELAQESIEAILKEGKEFKGGEFDNEEVKKVNSVSSTEEIREEETIGIELDVESDSKEKFDEIEVNDDDDWEGIERSELETMFGEAARFVAESGDKDERLTSGGSDVQMELYGLHKVATEGPCHEQPPMAIKVSARAKWNAWQRLEYLSPEAAMERYIALVSDRAPGWMEDKLSGDGKPGSSEVTIPVAVTPDLSTYFTDEMTCKNPEPKLGAEEGI